ncbi:2-oxo-tetronate isomerase [Aureimonas phyllosphaerae]|uniref:Hydroxypyruvate isomerase n=1 Tax=Aureimonas phyllosphaerae TaxID=1166078 RepID=A0A7W6BUZ0_9HYPH|nr:2-oxo-tetronate isomerase [Aureimonas phyllosphaerae]MBB3936534.1 hydroxypyruvate isomerase [Aureimonas phyllosphaerae]MBB3960602.1 hydroxypyruvate isomerase [Aureimonas phyllosphaerae]SFF28945.1 hydroxypyruvate isomerase [Aureimonas phyllosphaerae]
MPRFAANLTMMFNEVPFLDRFAEAGRAGFAGVEFLFPYEWEAEAIAERLRENALTQALFNMPPGDWAAGERGIACLPGREAEFTQGVETAVRYARTLGCRRVHAMAGLLPAGTERDQALDRYRRNIAAAARRLADDGLTLVIEPINTRDMPGYLLNHQSEAHALVAEIGEPNLKIQMDLYHAQIMDGDLWRLFEANQGTVGHIQIASVPDRHEPDEGEVNYPWLFERLDAAGYDGWVGCEYRPRGDTRAGLGWFAPQR